MKIILITFLIAIILSNIAFATGSVSITSVTIPSSVTTGDSFTITMSVSGTEVTSMQCSLTLPTSGLSCTGGTQSCDSGSASWSCTANVAGDYSNQITASISASYSGQPLSDTRQTGLQVRTPASLTASSTISGTSLTAGGSGVTFTVGVNNAGDTSTTYTISLTCPIGLSCSPTSVSTTSIDGSTLKNHAFTISGSTAGSYTITATITGNGQTLTTSQSVTVSAASSGQQTGSPGGGSPGGTTTNVTKVLLAKGNANITIPSVAAGKMTNVSITKTENVAFRQINISVVNSVNNIKIVITKLAGSPASVTHIIEGKVYHYIQIDKTNFTDTDLSKVYIKFAVNKTWLTDSGVDKTNISLYRWLNDKWNELTTSYLSEDTSEVLYQAESPGFSYFLIGTKLGEVTQAPTAPTGAAITCTENWSCTNWSICTNSVQTRTCTDSNACGTTVNKPVESQDCIEAQFQADNTWMYYSIAAVIIIAIVAILFIFRKKVITKPSKKK
jgi:PGF-pre-PGF domain-containing protein